MCQDIVLKAISESSFDRNVTIKGGVVMRSITGDVRRAKRDIDFDFIKYSIEEDAIRQFIQRYPGRLRNCHNRNIAASVYGLL